MKKCKYCQSEIDIKAKICPNCKKKQGKSKLLIALIIIILIMIIVSISSGSDESSKENNEDKVTEKFSYEITSQYADEYGFSYYIEGSVKNNKDKDYSYVQIEFICYDAEGNNLGTAIDNTNNLLGNETWKFKAMSMFSDTKIIDHCDYHEITSW